MINYLKKVFSISLIAAVIFTACNSNTEIQENFTASADADVSRSVVSTVRISSSLNPGFGQAVFFTGTFDGGNSWTTAIRGSYDNGWFLDVTASHDFEWKALTGDYNLGSFVTISSALVWESGANHVEHVSSMDLGSENLYVLSWSGNAHYGQACYFTGTFDQANNWQTAVKSDCFNSGDYHFYAFVTSSTGSFEWKTLTGFGFYEDTYAAPFNGLTWSNGANLTEANAITFEEYWANTAKASYFEANYDDKAEKLNFYGSAEIYGFNSTLQNKNATILEIVNADTDEVVFSGNYNDVKNTGIHFDKMDYSVYNVRLIPVSVYGDLGCPYEVTFSPAFVLIGAWSFDMGCDTDADMENQKHSVYMYKQYLISKYEVTDGEFQDVFGYSSSNLAYRVYPTADCPAVSINFQFAIAYCNLRSIKEGLEPVYSVEGVDFSNVDFNYVRYMSSEEKARWNHASVNWNANGYRLPTEAEWECAARDPQLDDELYSGSSNIYEVANTLTSNNFQPIPVGSLKANARGLYDMSGNVEEWVWDFYAPYSTDYQTDPVCDSGDVHIVRGGGFNYSLDECFTVYYRQQMTGYSSSTGLRVVRNGPDYN